MSADIKVGDLIKATNREDRDVTITGRVKDVSDYWVYTTKHTLTRDITWDLEVLERPEEPIDEELLLAVIKAEREARGYLQHGPDHNLIKYFSAPATAAIKAVREFDKSKETSK